MTSHPVDVGRRTEATILAYLVRRGYDVLVPFATNQRYDLVLDLEGSFVRAQCKTGRYRQGVIRFSTQSVVTSKTRSRPRGYDGDADVFLVHCPEFERIYCVPVAEATKACMYLRVDQALDGQSERVNWASDYELPA